MIDIAVVGAGFSGSLLALQILRASADARVFLIEQAAQFGRGLAYGAAGPEHLLNVRAVNMSAFPEEPDHFSKWFRKTLAVDEPPMFVSRQMYGTYLQTLLGAAIQTEHGAGRLIAIGDEAVALALDGTRPKLRLALGRDLDIDRVVLAIGNLPPHDLPCFVDADPSVYAGDPWSPDTFADLQPTDDVLLVGTGLTAIDMIIRLKTQGHLGSIRALSRRGLRPHRHENANPTMAAIPVPSSPSSSALLAHVRRTARAIGWREAVDGLRPGVQRLWQQASIEERRRFLRHLRPWWDIHRHRIAPEVADAIDALESTGQLSFHAGRIDGVHFDDRSALVEWTPRGDSEGRDMRVHRIVNCTGPEGDLRKTRSPLLRDLLESGLARPDSCVLGLDVDEHCRVVDADGVAHDSVLVVGPMSRGAFWEITAVPDIRVQTARIALGLATEATREKDASPTI